MTATTFTIDTDRLLALASRTEALHGEYGPANGRYHQLRHAVRAAEQNLDTYVAGLDWQLQQALSNPELAARRAPELAKSAPMLSPLRQAIENAVKQRDIAKAAVNAIVAAHDSTTRLLAECREHARRSGVRVPRSAA